MFLTPEQVIELSGRRQGPAQSRALSRMGIDHKIRADGRVMVAVGHVEKEFGVFSENKIKTRKEEPNWDAIK